MVAKGLENRQTRAGKGLAGHVFTIERTGQLRLKHVTRENPRLQNQHVSPDRCNHTRHDYWPRRRVDSLTTSSMGGASSVTGLPPIKSSTAFTRMPPSSNIGWRMVVRGGVV